jgi:hypothetical protein
MGSTLAAMTVLAIDQGTSVVHSGTDGWLRSAREHPTQQPWAMRRPACT